MSIYSDMDMYYRRSWLRYVDEGGIVRPFYVEQTVRRNDGTEHSDLDSDELSELLHRDHDAMKSELKFLGALYNHRGVCIDPEKSINFDDPRLIWEIPEIGYYKATNSWIWLTYAAVHSAKKGFNLDRISNGFLIRNTASVCKLLTQELSDQNPHRDVLVLNGNINYKGVEVGTVLNDQVSLLREAGYLAKFMKELFPNYEIEVL